MKKIFLLLTASVICFAATAAEAEKPVKKQENQHNGRRIKRPPRRNFQKDHGMWTAFADLSAEERQAMLKLQREDPEKFRAEMNKLAEKFFNAEKERLKEFAKLVQEYKSAGDEKTKSEIHEKIKSRVRDNFKRRLRQNRMHIEELKKRAENLEKELDIREKNEDKIVEATVNSIITGRRPKFSPRGPHHRPPFNMKRHPAPLKAE